MVLCQLKLPRGVIDVLKVGPLEALEGATPANLSPPQTWEEINRKYVHYRIPRNKSPPVVPPHVQATFLFWNPASDPANVPQQHKQLLCAGLSPSKLVKSRTLIKRYQVPYHPYAIAHYF